MVACYCEIWKVSAAVRALVRLYGLHEGICQAVDAQIQTLQEQNRKLDAILAEGHGPTVVPEPAGGNVQISVEVLCSVRQEQLRNIWLFVISPLRVLVTQ